MLEAEHELLDLFRSLNPEARQALLRRARELAAAAARGPVRGAEQETVVGAIRRLRQAYPAVERRRLVQVSADLLAAHLVEGRPAAEVIAELERAFYRESLRDS